MTVLSEARDFITSQVADLEGEDDPGPFMLINSPSGSVFVGLTMPDLGSPRDDVADIVAAMLVVHRATEAVFASCAWSVKSMSVDDREKWGNRDFAEHPDRQEIVFTIYVDSEGERFHTAPVTRKNNKVVLGDWAEDEDGRTGGRFGDAMRAGMVMARTMPAELVEFMEREINNGNEQKVINLIAQTHRRLRTSDVTDEELAEAQRIADQYSRR